MSTQERVFFYDGRKRRFPKPCWEIRTTLTDAEAEAILEKNAGEGPDDFVRTCMHEVRKAARGMETNANLLAWAHKKAWEFANPLKTYRLCPAILKKVAFRKPYTGAVDGHAFRLRLCGENSKHAGKIAIVDPSREAFSEGSFYGYATPEGKSFEWKPTRATPKAVIEAITSK